MQNISLVANLQTIWLCKQLTKTTWAEPVKKIVNIIPANSEAEIQAFGQEYIKYFRIKCSELYAKGFSVDDRVYFKKKLPTVHNPTQSKPEDANFNVQLPPLSTINVGTIYLKSITGK